MYQSRSRPRFVNGQDPFSQILDAVGELSETAGAARISGGGFSLTPSFSLHLSDALLDMLSEDSCAVNLIGFGATFHFLSARYLTSIASRASLGATSFASWREEER